MLKFAFRREAVTGVSGVDGNGVAEAEDGESDGDEEMEGEDKQGEREVEADSDHDDDQDYAHLHLGPGAHFSTALDSSDTGTVRRRTKTVVTPIMAMESFRLSFLTDDQDVNFDAILGELSELELQLTSTQCQLSQSLAQGGVAHTLRGPGGEGGSDVIQAELDALAAEITLGLSHRSAGGHHLLVPGMYGEPHSDAGETDSAFSDNTSLPSSESFTSMVTVSSSADTTSSSSGETGSMSSAVSAGTIMNEEEQLQRLKAEKIRIALEKIREAKIRKLFVRAFAKDGSSKSILVDEKMTVGQVCSLLADKHHGRLTHSMAVVEHMPDLFMERILEDHDSLVENMVMWTRDSKNKVLFEERQEKYNLFLQPEKYLLAGSAATQTPLGTAQKERLIQEFFSPAGISVPEVEGALYLKSDGKKAWKKYFFVLRASGLYYNPKGKVSKAPKELAGLVQLEYVEVYRGLGWKKKYHSPTDFCFALKHPQIQKKTSKYIRYFCAESETALDQWIMGIRVAKLGKQLLHNFEHVHHEIATWDLRQIPDGHTPTDIPYTSSSSAISSGYSSSSAASRISQGSVLSDQYQTIKPAPLHDSRLVLPESAVQHTVVSVHGPGGDYYSEVVTGNVEVISVPQRKGSEGGSEGGCHKTPTKRVSFSNTHCIITDNPPSALGPKHRDSIVSASTDSSEDSTSSGEGRHTIAMSSGGSVRSKMRARLPVTTETTRLLTEMNQISFDGDRDGGSNLQDETSSISSSSSTSSSQRHTAFSRLERRRSSMNERRGSDGTKRAPPPNVSSNGISGGTPMSPSMGPRRFSHEGSPGPQSSASVRHHGTQQWVDDYHHSSAEDVYGGYGDHYQQLPGRDQYEEYSYQQEIYQEQLRKYQQQLDEYNKQYNQQQKTVEPAQQHQPPLPPEYRQLQQPHHQAPLPPQQPHHQAPLPPQQPHQAPLPPQQPHHHAPLSSQPQQPHHQASLPPQQSYHQAHLPPLPQHHQAPLPPPQQHHQTPLPPQLSVSQQHLPQPSLQQLHYQPPLPQQVDHPPIPLQTHPPPLPPQLPPQGPQPPPLPQLQEPPPPLQHQPPPPPLSTYPSASLQHLPSSVLPKQHEDGKEANLQTTGQELGPPAYDINPDLYAVINNKAVRTATDDAVVNTPLLTALVENQAPPLPPPPSHMAEVIDVLPPPPEFQEEETLPPPPSSLCQTNGHSKSTVAPPPTAPKPSGPPPPPPPAAPKQSGIPVKQSQIPVKQSHIPVKQSSPSGKHTGKAAGPPPVMPKSTPPPAVMAPLQSIPPAPAGKGDVTPSGRPGVPPPVPPLKVAPPTLPKSSPVAPVSPVGNTGSLKFGHASQAAGAGLSSSAPPTLTKGSHTVEGAHYDSLPHHNGTHHHHPHPQQGKVSPAAGSQSPHRVSHIKHPSTGSPMLGMGPPSPQPCPQPGPTPCDSGYIEGDNSSSCSGSPSSVPYLQELTQRRPRKHSPEASPSPQGAPASPLPTGGETPSLATHRRSASAGSMMKGVGGGHHKGDRKAAPPPPPPRSENTRLSTEVGKCGGGHTPGSPSTLQPPSSPSSATLAPLLHHHQPASTPAVSHQQDPVSVGENFDGILDPNELPPPPPELLAGLPESAVKNMNTGGCATVPHRTSKKSSQSKMPPPPPRRNKDTHLTQAH